MEGLLKEFRGKSIPFNLNGLRIEHTYITRVDLLFGNVAKISEARAQRGIGLSVACDLRPIEKCELCEYERFTPKDRVLHACGAVSVPNKYPWEKYDWVTLYPPFGRHKLLLSELYFVDLRCM